MTDSKRTSWTRSISFVIFCVLLIVIVILMSALYHAGEKEIVVWIGLGLLAFSSGLSIYASHLTKKLIKEGVATLTRATGESKTAE